MPVIIRCIKHVVISLFYLKIVAAVAKENGYSYIFDVAAGGVAYYPETTGNITDLVKKRMGAN